VQDILAVDVSPTMVEALQQRAGPESTLGNDACVRTWLGEVVDLPSYLVSAAHAAICPAHRAKAAGTCGCKPPHQA
jgi:hypothetical protein